MIKKFLVSAVVFCLGSMMTIAVHAAVIEINNRAVKDAGGFPFEINKPGSYLLTSNLFVKGDVSAIVATKPAVTIDLNGFRILGQNRCTIEDLPPSVTCEGPNESAGISGAHRILNGFVSGFRSGIVPLKNQALVIERVTVKNHSGQGIDSKGENLILTNSVVSKNRGVGVNGQYGTGTYVVTHNVIEKNGIRGMYLAAGVASHNTFYRNIQEGIRSSAGRGAMVVNNFFEDNGTGLSGNMGYRSNVFDRNDTNVIGGFNLGQNVCDNALCP